MVQRFDGPAVTLGAPARREVEGSDGLGPGHGWVHAGCSFGEGVQATSMMDAGAAYGRMVTPPCPVGRMVFGLAVRTLAPAVR